MARRKRNSSTIEEAQRFLEALQTISETLDFGNGASVQAFLALIQEAQEKLAKYNRMLNLVDEAMRDVEDIEQSLKAMSKRLMMNIKATYGEDSREFQMAGGKLRSSSQSAKPRQTTESSDPSESSEVIDPSESTEMQMIIESKSVSRNGAKAKG